jgi:hypothetical protein
VKRDYFILFAAVLSIAPAVEAQTDREEATRQYLDMLEPSLKGRAPVDPSVALEGMSSQALLNDLTPGYVIIEGDIQVRLDEYLAHLEDPSRAVFGSVNFWPGQVPFEFAGNVNMTQQQAAIAAMNAISARTGVVFVPWQGEPDWIRFNASTFNNSPVGRQGFMQIINITSWGNQFVIVHEIYHSLGFWHQQSAVDRDTYVTINNTNICGWITVPGHPCHADVCQGCSDNNGNFISCEFNFDEVIAPTWGPYDFDSFMHYGRTAFSCNGNDTITVNQPWNAQWQSLIGQRNHFSLIDELACRGLYPLPGDRWLRAGQAGVHAGTFLDPFRGSFAAAYNLTPVNGTLLIDPGSYPGAGTYSEAKTIRATYGTVTIGN